MNFASYENLAEILSHIKKPNVFVKNATTAYTNPITGFKAFVDDIAADMATNETRFFIVPEFQTAIQPASGKYLSLNYPVNGFSPIKMVRLTPLPSGYTDYDGKYIGVKMTSGTIEFKNVILYAIKTAAVTAFYIMGSRDLTALLKNYTYSVYGTQFQAYGTMSIGIGDGSTVTDKPYAQFNIDDGTLLGAYPVSDLDGTDMAYTQVKAISRKNGANINSPAGADTYLCSRNNTTGNIVWNMAMGGNGIYLDTVSQIMDRWLQFDPDAVDAMIPQAKYAYQLVYKGGSTPGQLDIGDRTKFPLCSDGYTSGDYTAEAMGLNIKGRYIEIKEQS